MTILRDLRQRVEALEEQECAHEGTDHSRWAVPFAWALAAVGLFVSVAIAQFAPDQPRTDPMVECIKARGKWVNDWSRGRCEFIPEQK